MGAHMGLSMVYRFQKCGLLFCLYFLGVFAQFSRSQSKRLIKEVPKVENNPLSESYSYEYDYYDYYDPKYDYGVKENHATAVKYNQRRPSLLKRIISKIPILRERQGIVAPFFAPILVGIVVAVASIATASSPEDTAAVAATSYTSRTTTTTTSTTTTTASTTVLTRLVLTATSRPPTTSAQ